MAITFTIMAVIVVATIGGVLSGFLIHQYIRPNMPSLVAEALGGFLGIALCAFIVFALMWQLNPDPPGGVGNAPTIGGTAILTAFSALLWVPLFLVTHAVVSKRRIDR